MRLTPEAVSLRAAGWTYAAIGTQFGVTKTAVSAYLKRRAAGVRANHPARAIQCAACGVTVTRFTCAGRAIRPCCSRACYQTLIRQHTYRGNRHGQRLARLEMTRLYGPLPLGSVVHHRDGNCLHNTPDNLVLFASQADHMRFHRHGHAVPLWPTDTFFSSPTPV